MQQTSSPVVADNPFRIPVTPDEAFAHPRWGHARAALLANLARGGAVVLLGPPGSGKTLLLHDLAHTLRHEGRSVRLIACSDAVDPALTADVLLVDDAGFMDAATLAAVCAARTPLVLAANPSFANRLAGLPRPVVPVVLEPLPPQDVARFVAARLAASGQARDLLEPEAVLALARHSGGLLRLVNVLGAVATFLARLDGSPRVCLRHVEEAAAMRDGMEEDAEPAAPAEPQAARAATPAMGRAQAMRAPRPARQPRRIIFGAAAASLVLALAGGWEFWDRQVVQPSKTQANDGGSEDGDHFGGGLRTAGGPQLPNAPSTQGKTATGAPGKDPDAQPPRPGLGHDPGGQATRLDAVDPSRQAATPQREAKAANQSADPAVEPRQPVQPPDTPVAFRGPIINETMGRSGRVTLVISKQGGPGSVVVRFNASAGLLGSGELTGRLSEDGRITASGQLMMGSNPFLCDLTGMISGDTLTGSASFFRSSSGYTARSRFTLARS